MTPAAHAARAERLRLARLRAAVQAGARWSREAPRSFCARKSWWAELHDLTSLDRLVVREALAAALERPRESNE